MVSALSTEAIPMIHLMPPLWRIYFFQFAPMKLICSLCAANAVQNKLNGTMLGNVTAHTRTHRFFRLKWNTLRAFLFPSLSHSGACVASVANSVWIDFFPVCGSVPLFFLTPESIYFCFPTMGKWLIDKCVCTQQTFTQQIICEEKWGMHEFTITQLMKSLNAPDVRRVAQTQCEHEIQNKHNEEKRDNPNTEWAENKKVSLLLFQAFWFFARQSISDKRLFSPEKNEIQKHFRGDIEFTGDKT